MLHIFQILLKPNESLGSMPQVIHVHPFTLIVESGDVINKSFTADRSVASVESGVLSTSSSGLTSLPLSSGRLPQIYIVFEAGTTDP